jgi:hypothetical protein
MSTKPTEWGARSLAGTSDMDHGHRLWVHVEGWAAELGMLAPDVLASTANPPGLTRKDRSRQPADQEAGR